MVGLKAKLKILVQTRQNCKCQSEYSDCESKVNILAQRKRNCVLAPCLSGCLVYASQAKLIGTRSLLLEPTKRSQLSRFFPPVILSSQFSVVFVWSVKD